MNQLATLSVFTSLLIFSSCSNLLESDASEQPNPQIFSGSSGKLHFKFLTWNSGVRILLIDNLPKADRQVNEERPNTPWMTWKTTLTSRASGKQYFSYKITTYDGKRVGVSINDEYYDLEDGGVFLAKSLKSAENPSIEIQQKNDRLDKLGRNVNAVSKFINARPMSPP